MELIICAVRDAKSEAFGRPFFSQSMGIAIRSFSDEVNREHEDNTLNKHSEDFSLYALGKFDDSLGTFETETPRLMIQGNEVKALHHKISKV